MTAIDQSIFTSVQSERRAGYQLAAKSPGVGEQEERELSLWGPSHDSLSDDSASAASVQMQLSEGGRICISKTVLAGQEYSERTGQRVYTHSLLVPRDVFEKFSGNPFAILRAAIAVGSLDVQAPVPELLDSLRLTGRAAAVDHDLLLELVQKYGELRLAALLDSLIHETRPVVVVLPDSREKLVEGLLNCLPPSCRERLTFSTGLRFSSCRPVQFVCVGKDDGDLRAASRKGEILLIDFAADPRDNLTGWGKYIHELLALRCFTTLKNRFSRPDADFTWENLDSWGNRLQGTNLREECRENVAVPSRTPAQESLASPTPSPPVDGKNIEQIVKELKESVAPRSSAEAETDYYRRADERHPARGQAATLPSLKAKVSDTLFEDPAFLLSNYPPELMNRLDQLDDMVFEAMAGKDAAWEQLKQFWPETLQALGKKNLLESREHYIRHLMAVWKHCVNGDQIHDPVKAVRAMEILSLLLEE